jgi:predicted Fe-Mo cluster-binding NifX family protein
MRIAIPMAGGTLCPHFGHCEQFAIVDVDQGEILRTECETRHLTNQVFFPPGFTSWE